MMPPNAQPFLAFYIGFSFSNGDYPAPAFAQNLLYCKVWEFKIYYNPQGSHIRIMWPHESAI
jgi:hypothetical protein